MSRLATLLVLLAIGACAREPYTVCFGSPSGGNCKNFRSAQHYEAWQAAEDKKQRAEAAGFPDDFRDIVAAVLKDLLKTNESDFKNMRHEYFVSVFGEDIDPVTQSKLLTLGVETELASKYVENGGESSSQDTPETYIKTWAVYVSSLKRLSDGTYDIEFGYRCGMLCAGHFRYRVKRDSSGWVFVSKTPLSYS